MVKKPMLEKPFLKTKLAMYSWMNYLTSFSFLISLMEKKKSLPIRIERELEKTYLKYRTQ